MSGERFTVRFDCDLSDEELYELLEETIDVDAVDAQVADGTVILQSATLSDMQLARVVSQVEQLAREVRS